MTTTTTTTTTAPVRRRGPVAHAVAHQGCMNLYLFAWYWAIVLTGVVVGTVLLARANGEVDVAVSLYSRQGAIWFPFSQTILLLATHLRVHVAAGGTRRTFVRASVLVAAGTGVAYAVTLQLVALAERSVHGALGWDWRIADAMLADASSPAGLMLAELVVVLVAANVSGLLVGAVYQRTDGWRGTLALPLTVGPLLAVIALVGGVTDALAPAGDSWATAAPPLLAGVGVTALTVAAYAAVTRGVALRPHTG